MPKTPLPPRQQAKVLLLAKLKDETQEKTEAEAYMLNRIVKCREKGSNPTTSETEAKTALAMASRLMLAHNLSEHDVNNHSASEKTFEGGESTVRIFATRGESMQVLHESWVSPVANAMNALFDVQSFYQDFTHREHLNYVFCGIGQNTRMAANAFEIVHNLICEWSRGRGRSRTSYCMGVAEGFKRLARETKDQETLEMIRLDQEDLKTRLAKEQAEEKDRLDRLHGTPPAGADLQGLLVIVDSDDDDKDGKSDQDDDLNMDQNEEYFDAVEHMNTTIIDISSESESEGLNDSHRAEEMARPDSGEHICTETGGKADDKEQTERVDVPTTFQEQTLPSNANALTAYRGTAKDIADELMKKHHDGRRDARDIDIKRKRIENGAIGDEIVGVGSRRKM